MIGIDDAVAALEDEVWFTASRSAGPGGQHVNTSSTRVTLHLDLHRSRGLSEAQKEWVALRLANRINRNGILKMHSQRHRSQAANKVDLVLRFAGLMREALREPRVRRRSRVPRGSRERRIRSKRIRGEIKAGRRRPAGDD